MSRALNKHIISALKQGDHEKIFNDISGLLMQSKDDGLFEIEILGQGHPMGLDENFLRDENAVAIPKLRIVQAFLFARQIFQKHLTDGSVGRDQLMAATSVLLLMDPEHLSAANTRKRLLCDAISTRDTVKTYLAREKWFVDSLLTSRLHRHTKSPTLWSHRRWLSERYHDAGLPVVVQQDIETVVMMAGERHPRNYYAWTHARWLTKTYLVVPEPDVLVPLIQSVKKWSFRHQSDISGWAFLAHLLDRLGKDDRETASLVFNEALGLAESLRWYNESVWWFLRTIASWPELGQIDRDNFASVQERLVATSAEDSHEDIVLRTARAWWDVYGTNGKGAFPENL
ncbi:hypothetical protein CORC01_07675 [Colletotrichum orchidophilum]|uniref:Protein prenyltransferase n=1 Tax=Colletotrichum orchidophilum TaxID=1209926 RepID=A0A1G4B6W1_9PEZI|nr:uncharacterized protein CORC01_07675 [Colletotrichum orchidophilum]OHE97066.1 hypothetical protein CORC01_07675 [Colletotrichum orchidophilum]